MNFYINDEVLKSFNRINDEIKTGNLEEEEIFRAIGELDKEYKDDSFYKLNVNGFIANIGIDIKSEKILNYAIKRLKKNY